MWDWFVSFLTQVLAAIQGFCGDWGLAIVILTCIVRLIVTPLMIRSTASSARMQALQPKMQEIQERYADDPQRQQQELQKFYSENKFNPLGGCLPIVLQMPVFFALFSMLRNELPKIAPDACFYNILPKLSASAKEMFAAGGLGSAWVYLIFVIAFGALTFIPMLLNLGNTTGQQRQQTLIMGAIMSVMMVWVGWALPAGVNVYYVTSAIWQVIQQKFVTSKVMEQVKAEEAARLADRPVEVNVMRKERKQRPHKKSKK